MSTHEELTPHEATAESEPAAGVPLAQTIVLTVVDPPQAEASFRAAGRSVSIGSHPSNDVVLADTTVSRFHCEILIGRDGVRIADLGSRNGTVVDGVRVERAFLGLGSHVRLGRLTLRFDAAGKAKPIELSASDRFGLLVGGSAPMRAAFALLERAASSDATLLLEGETGTGKGAAAESLHLAGARKDRPFMVVDCGAIAPSLLESELFGHERGAFTGADSRRIGAFEEAEGGTIFLDEIGELPAELQPKLLRVLDKREIRRLGQNAFRPVDVRVVAATNRDLRSLVNEGKFRADLYYRLAVVRVQMPSLRQRLGDLPLLVSQLVDSMRVPAEQRARLLDPELLANLRRSVWPGNVRELRNYVERALILREPPQVGEAGDLPAIDPAIDDSLPFSAARQQAMETFERRYLQGLLARYQWKVSAAAKAAGVGRVYMYRLLGKHGMRG